MTHGPPAGYGDEKKGDTHLRKVLDSPESSVKLHLFGHAHSNGFHQDDREWTLHGNRYSGRCFVNASLSTSFYVPTRLPIVFDVPVVDKIDQTAASNDVSWEHKYEKAMVTVRSLSEVQEKSKLGFEEFRTILHRLDPAFQENETATLFHAYAKVEVGNFLDQVLLYPQEKGQIEEVGAKAAAPGRTGS